MQTRFIERLRAVLDERASTGLVAIYVDPSDCDLFEAGAVRRVGNELLVIEAVGSNGDPEGMLYLPMREVRRMAYGTKYLDGIKFLRGRWAEIARRGEQRLALGSFRDDLAHAREAGWIVQVHCRESADWAGFVLAVGPRWVHMAVVVEEGELDGYLILDLDEIERVEVGGPSQLAHELLFRRRLGIEGEPLVGAPEASAETSFSGWHEEADIHAVLAQLRGEHTLAGVYRRGGEGGYRAGYIEMCDSSTLVLHCVAPGGHQDGVLRIDAEAVYGVRWNSEYLRALGDIYEQPALLAGTHDTIASGESLGRSLAELADAQTIVTISERDGHQITGRIVEVGRDWLEVARLRGGRQDGVFLLQTALLLSIRTGGVDEMYEEFCAR
jgi:hypothetical protein